MNGNIVYLIMLLFALIIYLIAWYLFMIGNLFFVPFGWIDFLLINALSTELK